MKYTLEGNDSRINEAEEQIRELEDRGVKITATEYNKEKRMKRYEDNLRDTLNAPTFALQASQGKEREWTLENI